MSFDPTDKSQVDSFLKEKGVTVSLLTASLGTFGGNPDKPSPPPPKQWYASWEHGIMDLLPEHDFEDKARAIAALFCKLWLANRAGEDTGLIPRDFRDLAYFYVNRVWEVRAGGYTGYKYSVADCDKINNWIKEHDLTCKFSKNQGAIGGRLVYTFCPVNLGLVAKVKCACGEELDLTDYHNW